MRMSQRKLDAMERIKSDLTGAIDRAIDIVCKITSERRTTRLTIPVDFDRDEDVILINTYKAARDEIAPQAARIAELEALLSHLEWCRIGWNICPMCGCPEMLGHDDDCELDALLHKETTDESES